MQTAENRAYCAAPKLDPKVTLDVDVHLVESSRSIAPFTYGGFRGYQPLLVQWAETDLILADQFRDGNMPTLQNINELVDQAYEAQTHCIVGLAITT